jgi:hypothetical protein
VCCKCGGADVEEEEEIDDDQEGEEDEQANEVPKFFQAQKKKTTQQPKSSGWCACRTWAYWFFLMPTLRLYIRNIFKKLRGK